MIKRLPEYSTGSTTGSWAPPARQLLCSVLHSQRPAYLATTCLSAKITPTASPPAPAALNPPAGPGPCSLTTPP